MSVPERNVGRMAGIGGAAGIAAYVLGYLLTYVTQRGSVDEELRRFNVAAELFGGDPIPSWQAVGWLFYNAHTVDTEIPGLGLGGDLTVNFVASADEWALTLLYLVPPVLLLGAGFLTAALSRVDSSSAGGVAGAFVVVGYLPLAVAGTVVFAYALGDGSIAPDTITAVVLAGVVYPIAFGGIGGAIAGEITSNGRQTTLE